MQGQSVKSTLPASGPFQCSIDVHLVCLLVGSARQWHLVIRNSRLLKSGDNSVQCAFTALTAWTNESWHETPEQAWMTRASNTRSMQRQRHRKHICLCHRDADISQFRGCMFPRQDVTILLTGMHPSLPHQPAPSMSKAAFCVDLHAYQVSLARPIQPAWASQPHDES